ncbi:TetR/AcrR family transcriptional regulator [Acetobacter vaccinii]|uniref:TetR/AcrR family transcriptional regulator n=1 Tax=Acetobacter vaccinii TaxID=2592655 RepID=A0A5C1YKY9_9PROT|nr:TetR/AcrR family transcriptional regulator [Acetobacter vaccinii]QEO16713.1 TetR/AcrR family transcriptional regulator [Acetobacter vaccinii]
MSPQYSSRATLSSMPRTTQTLDMTNPCLDGRKRRCGRPSTHDTEELDQYLLEIAAGLFSQHGYAGTSIDQIARKASASKQTLYRRYPSKEALFIAVIMNLTRCLRQAMEETTLHDPLEELRYISRLLLELTLSPQSLGTYRILIADGHRHPSLLRQAITSIGEPFHRAFLKLLTAAEARGQIAPGNADDTTAHLLTGMITGWPLEDSLFGLSPLKTKQEQDDFFDRAWSFFLRAVGGSPHQPAS